MTYPNTASLASGANLNSTITFTVPTTGAVVTAGAITATATTTTTTSEGGATANNTATRTVAVGANLVGSFVHGARFTKAGSPWVLTGYYSIPNNDSLVIDPGARVNLNGQTLYVNSGGKLSARGTTADTIRFFGVDATGGTVQLSSNTATSRVLRTTFLNIQGTALYLESGALPVVNSCRFAGNTVDIQVAWNATTGLSSLKCAKTVRLSGGESGAKRLKKYAVGATYQMMNSPYYGSFLWSVGDSLTIEAGVKLDLNGQSFGAYNDTKLRAQGTASDSIRITSSQPGGYIYLANTNALNKLAYVSFRGVSGGSPLLTLQNGNHSLSNCRFAAITGTALQVDSGTPTITNSIFTGNGLDIQMPWNATGGLNNVSFAKAVQLVSGTSGAMRLKKYGPNAAYQMASNLDVYYNTGDSLTIEAGVKLNLNGRYLNVGNVGRLRAQGTATDSISITNSSASAAAFYFSNSNASLQQVKLNGPMSVSVSSPIQVLAGCSFRGGAELTMSLGSTETQTLPGVVFAGFNTAVSISAGNALITDSYFNALKPKFGINATGASQVTATRCWFGHSSGAYNATSNPSGLGCQITYPNVTVNASAAPTLTSFSPTSGAVGTAVTLTGTNFTGAISMKFNGVAAAFTVNSPINISTTVPMGATTGKIAVVAPGGSVQSATNFTMILVPTITSFTPTSGLAGMSVTITGTNLTGATSVKFNGTAATIGSNSATSITTTVPAGATMGTITVTTPGGTATSATSFTVTVPAPTITSFNPTTGPIGQSVTITGTNFTNASAVKFSGTAAAGFTVNTATSITATVAAGTTTGTVSVTTLGGTATSAGTFTVMPAPTVTSFTPTSGLPGASVTITGTNFTNASAVKFNGTAAASFSVTNATTISAVVGTGTTTGTVSVTTPGGMGTSAASFTVPAPTISGLAPITGPIGTTVTISGANFTGATAVSFNGTAAQSFTVTNATTISAVVAAGTAPTVTGLSPSSGLRGSTVVVTGTGFIGVTSVKLGALAAVYTVNSSTQITLTVPATAVTAPIYVTTSTAGMAQSTPYTVLLLPTISSFSPLSGPVGSLVTINGTNFAGISGVAFGGVTATSYTVVSTAKITATVPTGALTGAVTVTNAVGTASKSTFTVTIPPTISNFSPGSGLRGSSVVVTGTNFTGATAVKLGTLAATYTVNSATQLTLTVPATAITGTISVTTPGGTATSATPYTVILLPTISSFSPLSGPVGTLVTINGTNYTGITSVSFGGVAATSYSVVSTTRITATVPLGAISGAVTVTNAAGTASKSTFTVTTTKAPTFVAPVEPLEFVLYPNPAYQFVGVQVTNLPTATATADLLDGLGRVVRTVEVNEGTTHFSLTGLPPGLYVLRLLGRTQRLVVE